MVAQSAAFKKAVEDSRKLKAKPNNDELLELYANYKQGTGEDFSKATQPGTFAFQEKYKYNAWKKVAEEDKVTPSAAQSHYVSLVEKLKGVYGFNA
ncbi:acyl-CoA-binding protein [Usnea florida]